MFLVGLELNLDVLRNRAKAVVLTATAGIVFPFLGGVALTLGLLQGRRDLNGPGATPLMLCLFMGAAMSITAFPVLARILKERRMHRTPLAAMALTCAAMQDVMGWCVLAIVLALTRVQGAARPAVIVLASAGYVAVMLLAAPGFLRRFQSHFESRGYLSQGALAALFLLLLASSEATQAIGIHPILGAFLFGAVMPRDARFVRHIAQKMEDVTMLFLLPIFFAYTGLRTDVTLLDSAEQWMICAAIILTAVAGKFGGVCAAGRAAGMSWRKSALLGVLMNTRGLMELIVLNIGLSLGVLSRGLFTMMVVMALATTSMTTPLMQLFFRDDAQDERPLIGISNASAS
jgi:Kef-type K+ transport system membrane component KefB